MKSSKYIKIDNNVLIEYQYNSNNNVAEDYKILSNRKTNASQFISTVTEYKNTQDNQLFMVDTLNNKAAKIDTSKYSYLQLKDYAGSTYIKYDIIKVYFPTNYVFDEFKGFKIKLYTYDYTNENEVILSNYFYDISDSNRTFEFDFENPPMLFNEKLWGKSITIQVPSVSVVALQREDNRPKTNSLNYNLNSDGLSLSASIFMDFSFISKIETINSEKYYTLAEQSSISFPQTAEYESLSVKIQHSTIGDYYEIFGIYNGTQAEFVDFINNSIYMGSRYMVEYVVTMFEENIKGKTNTYLIEDNFDEVLEFRPIIKFSTTTAIINVEMRLIDKVTETQILKNASYGLLPNEVSKFSLSLTKINLSDATKPKIYNTKLNNLTNAELSSVMQTTNFSVEIVKVPYAVYNDKSNVIAKSDNVEADNTTWKGTGQLRLVIMPFDNVIKITLAKNITNVNNITTIEYFNLTLSDNINLVFKNNATEVKCQLQKQSSEVDLTKGMLVFKVASKDINNIRSIYNSKINTFYITSTATTGETSVLYAGLFIMFDNINNVVDLNNTKNNEVKSYIIRNNSNDIETAIITQENTNNTQENTNNTQENTNNTQENTNNSFNNTTNNNISQ